MRVLIFGSRGWHDAGPINAVIAGYDVLAEGRGQKLTVIHGDARSGADKLADTIAKEWGAEVIPEPADWGRYGKAAGPIRNQKMLDDHQPEVAWGFRATGKSTGTDDMADRCKAAGIPCYLVTQH